MTEIFIKGGLIAIATYLLFLPVMYFAIRRRLTPQFAAIMAGLAGALSGVVMNGPDYDSVGVLIGTTIGLAAGPAVAMFLFVRLIRSSGAWSETPQKERSKVP